MHAGALFGKVAAALVVAVGTTASWGVTLTPVGVLDTGNPLSQINAITPDGQYAVGSSQLGETSVPVVWSSSGGLVMLPNQADAGSVSEARGVIVRPGDAGNPDIIGIAGHATSGWAMQWYEAPVNNIAGSTWNDPSNDYVAGPYNAARMLASGPTWYIAGQRNGSDKAVRQRINGFIAADWQGGTGKQVANSVSSNSVGVGYHSPLPAGRHAAAYWTAVNSNGGFHAIPGGAQTFSEGYGISSDGIVMSGLDGSSSTEYQAFIYKQGDAGMTLLGMLPGDTQSVAIAVNNNQIAVGYSSDGAADRAVIWDSTGLWDASGQVKLVSDLLAAAGVDVSPWSQLSRITTISDDGMTVAGWGVWAADGSTRGFVATIPEPATALLLAVAGLGLVRRRG